jgi:hypothetical protein
MIPEVEATLDALLADPLLRVAHRRESSAAPERLWEAARSVRLADAGLLGRLVRWRIPGLRPDLAFDQMFRGTPFAVLHEEDHALVSGIVGRIWTLRRDYPELGGAEEFQQWSRRGTARVLFANWVEPGADGGAAVCSETRVAAVGAQGRLGVAAVRPLIRGFHHLIGSEALTVAVQRAEGR